MAGIKSPISAWTLLGLRKEFEGYVSLFHHVSGTLQPFLEIAVVYSLRGCQGTHSCSKVDSIRTHVGPSVGPRLRIGGSRLSAGISEVKVGAGHDSCLCTCTNDPSVKPGRGFFSTAISGTLRSP